MDEKGPHKSKGNLEVIGTGLPRTGTLSLKTALEILGYSPCHHFKTNIIDDGFPWPESQLWQRACKTHDAKERQKILKQIYEDTGCRAAVDYPTSNFVEDLVEMYPDAKFVHGMRSSPQIWRRSFNQTVGRVYDSLMYYSCFLMPVYRVSLYPLMSGFEARNKRVLGVGMHGSEDDIEIYHRHNDHVRRVVPSEQRLEFEPKDGWEPLCKFLNVPVPMDESGNKLDYPHVNDTESIRRGMSIFIVMGSMSWVLLLGSMGVATWYFWRP